MAKAFSYSHDFARTDFRKHPELYRIGKGEQGVLLCEPMKSEILPHWKFASPAEAQVSADKIFSMFKGYLAKHDFPSADVARKFLEMGHTRSLRYANHSSGHKYAGPVPIANKGQSGAHGRKILPQQAVRDPEKVKSAAIFKAKWEQALADPEYQKQKKEFEEKYK